jgi:hypothetical protein
VAAVLGKVTGGADGPRGPDANYRICVPQEWLDTGATIAVDLPRHLECAACSGGGCDACGGSGALTLRGREDAPETLQLTLPQNGSDPGGRGVVLRIPEAGGHATPGSDLPRGLLLLSLVRAAQPDANVRRWSPPGPAVPTAAGRSLLWAAVLLAVVLALSLLLLRWRGCY